MRHILALITLLSIILSAEARAADFDHEHTQWTLLLSQHVTWGDKGHASQVDYSALKKEQQALDRYLALLSGVSGKTYKAWSRSQRLAFLINAYNAFTVKLILSRHPNISSIKELGSLFSSPWKKRFFNLLGKERSLDEIEHEMIRAPGVFDEPRIHVAVVCASIGCPALIDRAYTAGELEQQLEESLTRFLSDRSRNRYNPEKERLEVSKIFDWYEEDFSKKNGRFSSLKALFSEYAALLSDDPTAQQAIVAAERPITFLDYDWQLNDKK